MLIMVVLMTVLMASLMKTSRNDSKGTRFRRSNEVTTKVCFWSTEKCVLKSRLLVCLALFYFFKTPSIKGLIKLKLISYRPLTPVNKIINAHM